MPLTDAEKKRAQRKREKSFGTVNVNVKLSTKQDKELLTACEIRGGIRGPYDRNEYILTLLRRDTERLNEQLSVIGKCTGCDKPLPQGCGGKRKAKTQCYHHFAHRELML